MVIAGARILTLTTLDLLGLADSERNRCLN
jgi:hypothetical protein